MSRREFLGEEAAGDDDRDDWFYALNADYDGRLTSREWHGTRDAFQWLDRDSDGVLTRAEVLGETQPTRTLFDRLDIDHNARITLNQWRWSKASFDRRDLDRNGSLTRHELTAATEPRSDAYQKGAERGLADGRQAGREDKTRRNRWDLEGYANWNKPMPATSRRWVLVPTIRQDTGKRFAPDTRKRSGRIPRILKGGLVCRGRPFFMSPAHDVAVVDGLFSPAPRRSSRRSRRSSRRSRRSSRRSCRCSETLRRCAALRSQAPPRDRRRGGYTGTRLMTASGWGPPTTVRAARRQPRRWRRAASRDPNRESGN